jgi:hypothetical protein
MVISALATCFASFASSPVKVRCWERLVRIQIAKRCRLKANEALSLAESASPYVKLAYLEIAEDWKQLARDIEWAANKQAVPARSVL